MSFDASIYSILLTGPRVCRLQPFFAQQGYRVHAVATGGEGLEAMRAERFHLVALELDLDDVDSHDFLEQALQITNTSAFMLLEDAAKTHQIVSCLVHGVDVYVPVPPDEARMFAQVQRHCIAAAARGGGTGTRDDQLESQLEKNREMLKSTGAKVRALKDQNKQLEAALELEREKVSTLSQQVEKLHADVAEAERKVPEPTQQGASRELSREEIEDLKAKRDFLAFLESENDELKKERDRLQQQLKTLGAAGAEFDEPTGESVVSESGLDAAMDASEDDGLMLSFDGEADASDEGTDVIAIEEAAPQKKPVAVAIAVADEPSGEDEATNTNTTPMVMEDDFNDMATGVLNGLQAELADVLASDEADADDAPPFAAVRNDFVSQEEVSESRIDELLAGVSQEDDDADLMSVPDDLLGDDANLPVRDFHDLISPAGKSPPTPRRKKRPPAPTRPVEAGLSLANVGDALNDALADVDPAGDTALSNRPPPENTTAGRELAGVSRALHALDESMIGIDDDLPERTKTSLTPSSSSAGWGARDSVTPTQTIANEPQGFSGSDLSFSVSDGGAEPDGGVFEEATVAHDMLAQPDMGADDFDFDDRTAARPMVPDALIEAALANARKQDEAGSTRIVDGISTKTSPLMSAPDEEDLGFDIDLD